MLAAALPLPPLVLRVGMRAATTRAAARERGGWADEFDRIRASPLARSATHSHRPISVAAAPGSTSSPSQRLARRPGGDALGGAPLQAERELGVPPPLIAPRDDGVGLETVWLAARRLPVLAPLGLAATGGETVAARGDGGGGGR